MGGRRDQAAAAHGQGGQHLHILAGQHLQPAMRDHGLGLVQRTAAVLHGADIRMPGQRQQRGGLDLRAGAVGNVIDDERHGRCIGQRAEIIRQASLAGTHVIGRGREQAGQRTRGKHRLAAQHVALVVAGQAHDDRQGAGLVEHGVQHHQLLILVHGGGLAGAAADHHAVDAGLAVLPHQAAQGKQIGAILIERRHQGNPDAMKGHRGGHGGGGFSLS